MSQANQRHFVATTKEAVLHRLHETVLLTSALDMATRLLWPFGSRFLESFYLLFKYIITVRVSEKGNKMSRVRPFVDTARKVSK